ncbi:MAG: hypothetical protein Q8910_00855 [Bacteroidota bacterium]|nr:hypothetical protein [Bacteroidota bacterium]
MASNNQNYRIKVLLETSEAKSNLKELNSLLRQMQSLSNKGENVQRGFLSSKQVRYYNNMMDQASRSIEGLRQRHEKLAERADTRYQKYSANPTEHNRLNYEQAMALRDTVHNTLTHAESQYARIDSTSRNIGGLRESNILSRGMGSMGPLMHFLPLMGAYDMANYARNSVTSLRGREYQASQYAMRLGGTYGSNFYGALKDMQNTGMANGYTSQQTLDTANALITTQGTSGNKNNIKQDVTEIQNFSRAYSVNPDSMAYAGGSLAQMGSTSEGGQRRFARLLAGEIKKTNMNGREAELLRSTMNLVNQVSSGQTNFTPQQLATTMNMQAILGQAIPTLRGDRGASVLSSLDAGFKNPDDNLDILMGKGTNPAYEGVSGRWDLKLQEAKGLTPENLNTVMTNLESLTGGLSPKDKHAAISGALLGQFGKNGLTAPQVEDLLNSGAMDDLRHAKTGDDAAAALEKAGIKDENLRKNFYDNSVVGQQNKNQAMSEARSNTLGSLLGHMGTGIMGAFNQLGAGGTLLAGGAMGLGSYKLFNRFGIPALRSLGQRFMPTINQGGVQGAIGQLFNTLRNPPNGPTGGGPVILGPNGNPLPPSSPPSAWNSVKNIGKNFWQWAKPTSGSLGTFGSNATSVAKSLTSLSGVKGLAMDIGKGALKKAPIIGGLIGTGADMAGGMSLGHSLLRNGAGMLGGALGGILGLGTGGLASAGLGIGGYMLGQKLGDGVYNLFNPPAKSLSQQDNASPVDESLTNNPQVQSVNTTDINANNIKVRDYNLSDVLKDKNSPSYKSYNSEVGPGNAPNPNNVITHDVKISGGIDGMTPDNQVHVKNSISNYMDMIKQSFGPFNLSTATAPS